MQCSPVYCACRVCRRAQRKATRPNGDHGNASTPPPLRRAASTEQFRSKLVLSLALSGSLSDSSKAVRRAGLRPHAKHLSCRSCKIALHRRQASYQGPPSIVSALSPEALRSACIWRGRRSQKGTLVCFDTSWRVDLWNTLFQARSVRCHATVPHCHPQSITIQGLARSSFLLSCLPRGRRAEHSPKEWSCRLRMHWHAGATRSHHRLGSKQWALAEHPDARQLSFPPASVFIFSFARSLPVHGFRRVSASLRAAQSLQTSDLPLPHRLHVALLPFHSLNVMATATCSAYFIYLYGALVDRQAVHAQCLRCHQTRQSRYSTMP